MQLVIQRRSPFLIKSLDAVVMLPSTPCQRVLRLVPPSITIAWRLPCEEKMFDMVEMHGVSSCRGYIRRAGRLGKKLFRAMAKVLLRMTSQILTLTHTYRGLQKLKEYNMS